MVKRLLHRCNSPALVKTAEALKYDGIEFDVIGDSLRRPIVAHNHGDSGIPLPIFLTALPSWFSLAINVKEYGLGGVLRRVLETSPKRDYFIFDVPGPELEEYAGLRVFGRVSEYEAQSGQPGILLDSFSSDPDFIAIHAASPCAAISPRLRGKDEYSPEVLGLLDYLITK